MSSQEIRGSGGCFHADTLVSTPTGPVKISSIQVDDEVYSFDDKGVVSVSKVLKTFTHKEEPIYLVEYWNGSLKATSNHWVLNQYYSFVEVGTMTEEDCLVDELNHLRPVKSITFLEDAPVYNLIVSGNHTFIADGIRVHNGGKGAVEVRGSGGGGKGGGGSARAPQEDPDTLRSTQYAKVLDLVSEGEIEGLANGLQSIYLDNTPLANTDGSLNFGSFNFGFTTGTQTQEYIDGFTAIESENIVGVRLAGSVTGDETIVEIPTAIPHETSYTIQNISCTGEIKIYFSSTGTIRSDLDTWKISSKFDQGDPNAYVDPIDYKIEISPNAGPFQLEATGSITAPDEITGDVTEDNQKNDYKLIYLSKRNVEDVAIGVIISLTPAVPHDIKITRTDVDPGAGQSTLTVDKYSYYPTTAPTIITQRLTDPNLTATRVTLSVPRLTEQDKKTGDLHGYKVNYAIYLQENNGGYYEVLNRWFDGKTTSKYKRSHVIPLSGTGPWDIRCERLSDSNEGDSAIQDEIYWDTYTEIIDHKLSYPNSAYAAIKIDAAQFDNIPTRAYDLKLLKVRIPSNYDPLTRVYTGEWDGTFVVAWTDNPAWCFYDLVTTERYGLGSFIDPAFVDKWALYSIAQYCDELVPDGLGGTEPRFTCNIYLQTRTEAYTLLRDMASVFRGMLYWNSNSIIATQDKPETVAKQFTNADIIDGEFVYEGSASKARHTVALVAWNDPAYGYKKMLEYVEDQPGIAKYGVNEKEVVAFGCTSRGQAARLGKWILFAEVYENEVVNFKTSFEGAQVYPGAIIRTMDQFKAGVRHGGRVISYTPESTSIEIDSPIEIKNGFTYTFSVYTDAGEIVDKTITNAITAGTTTLTLDSAIIPPPAPLAIWIVTYGEVEAEEWRVIGVTETEKNEFAVSALSYNASKYAAVEDNLTLEEPSTTVLENAVQAVDATTVVIDETLYLINYKVFGTKIHLSWEEPINVTKYAVSYRRDEGNYTTIPVNSPSIEITDQRAGHYYFKIMGYNALGVTSPPTVFEADIAGITAPPEDVLNFSHNVTSNIIHLTWDLVSDIDVYNYEIRKGGADWDTATFVANVEEDTVYQVLSQLGTETYRIKAIDVAGNYSVNSNDHVVTLTLPVVNTINYSFNEDNIILSWTGTAGTFLIADYEIRKGGTDWATASVVEISSGTTFTAPILSNDEVYRIKAIDSSGNISASSTDVTYNIPVPTISTFTAEILNNAVILNWSAATTGLLIDHYEIRYGETSWESATPEAVVQSSNYTAPVAWASRTYRIKAYDKLGNVSLESTVPVTITLPQLNANITSFNLDTLTLTIAPVEGSLSIKSYEIRSGGTDWDSASIEATIEELVYSETISWSSKIFRIKATDLAGNESLVSQDTTVTISNPVLDTFTSNISSDSINLEWTATKSTLEIDHYEVRYDGASWEVSSLDSIVEGNNYSTPVIWGSRTYRAKAIDVLGNESNELTLVSTIALPTMNPVTHSFNETVVSLAFSPIPGDLSVKEYEVRTGGADWATASIVGTYSEPTYQETIAWSSKLYRVKVKDIAGNYSAVSYDTTITITAPVVDTLTSTYNIDSIDISWSATRNTLPISHYVLKYNGTSWADAPTLAIATDLSHIEKVSWTSRTIRIKAIDILGNESNEETLVSTITAPNSPVATVNLADGEATLVWTCVAQTLVIDHFEVKGGGTTWENASTLAIVQGNTYTETVDWTTRKLWVKAFDSAGNESVIASETDITITSPVLDTLTHVHTNDSLVLNWTSTRGSLGIKGYEVAFGGTDWATATYVGTYEGSTYQIPVSWTSRVYRVRAIDTADNISNELSITSTVVAPEAPVLYYSFIEDSMLLEFSSATNTLSITEYEVREGGSDWATANNVITTTGSSYALKIDNTYTTKTFRVRARDTSGLESTDSSTAVPITLPSAPVISETFANKSVIGSWTSTPGSFKISHYEVRADGTTWENSPSLGFYDVTSITLLVDWLSRKFFVRAIDIAGFESVEGERDIVMTPPAMSTFTNSVIDNNVLLRWSVSTNSLPSEEVEVRRGATYETADIIGRKTGTFTVLFEPLGGSYTYWITPIDTAGNYGTGASQTALVSQPPDYVLRQEWTSDLSGDKVNMKVISRIHKQSGMEPSEIDDWVDTGTNNTIVPSTDYYSGTQAALIKTPGALPSSGGDTSSIALLISEPISTHRLANYTVRVSVRAKQPLTNAASNFALQYSTNEVGDSGWQTFTLTPSWQLFEFTYAMPASTTFDYLGIWADTASGSGEVLIDEVVIAIDGYGTTFDMGQGSLIGPIELEDTFAEHFTTNSWTNPNDQITASYPYYAQPTPLTASYEEIFDYGTILNATKIAVTPTYTTVTGTVDINTTISVSPDNSAWTDYVGVTEVIGSNYRYVKVKLDLSQTADDHGFIELSNINVKLDTKLINDAGSGSITTQGVGETVSFNTPFVDIAAIIVTPQGTSALTAVVDFVDAPNPTSFDVYLFNSDGTAAAATSSFSWTARGY